MSQHLEIRQKYSATRRIFNSLLGVWKCDETLSLVFDILHLTAVFMYSYNHDSLPAYFKNFFVNNEFIHSYNTRSASKIHTEFKRTNYGRFSLRYMGAIMWNSLPIGIKSINSSNLFKKVLKLYDQNQLHNIVNNYIMSSKFL